MKNVFKTIFDNIMFILTGKGEIANEAVNEGLIDYSGQGRGKNGR